VGGGEERGCGPRSGSWVKRKNGRRKKLFRSEAKKKGREGRRENTMSPITTTITATEEGKKMNGRKDMDGRR
jgi:hypothetical protein